MAELVRFRLRSRRELTVTPVPELPDDAMVIPVGMVGATSALTGKLPGGHEFADAVAAIERWTGTTAAAVVSIEIGGTNGLLGLVAADELGLVCVDADLCGRALSRLDQFSLVAAGHELGPVALSEPGGQLTVLDRSTPARIERTVRALVMLSGWGMLALAPVRASELAGCAVLGTVGGALRLGELALSLSPSELAEAVGGRLLVQGRVVEVARRLELGRHDNPGFGRGSATVQDTIGGLLRLEMENEYLLALREEWWSRRLRTCWWCWTSGRLCRSRATSCDRGWKSAFCSCPRRISGSVPTAGQPCGHGRTASPPRRRRGVAAGT